MIKINLISRKSRAYKGRNWTKIIVYILFCSLGLYFISVTLYVVISMYVYNQKIALSTKESTAISSEMIANSDMLSRFVLTKLILTKIQSINANRFHYKDYLDQASLLLPDGTLLSSVDFSVPGWIALAVTSTDVNAFASLEKSLTNNDFWTGNKYFSGAYIESVTKGSNGNYATRLQFEIKKING